MDGDSEYTLLMLKHQMCEARIDEKIKELESEDLSNPLNDLDRAFRSRNCRIEKLERDLIQANDRIRQLEKEGPRNEFISPQKVEYAGPSPQMKGSDDLDDRAILQMRESVKKQRIQYEQKFNQYRMFIIKILKQLAQNQKINVQGHHQTYQLTSNQIEELILMKQKSIHESQRLNYQPLPLFKLQHNHFTKNNQDKLKHLLDEIKNMHSKDKFTKIHEFLGLKEEWQDYLRSTKKQTHSRFLSRQANEKELYSMSTRNSSSIMQNFAMQGQLYSQTAQSRILEKIKKCVMNCEGSKSSLEMVKAKWRDFEEFCRSPNFQDADVMINKVLKGFYQKSDQVDAKIKGIYNFISCIYDSFFRNLNMFLMKHNLNPLHSKNSQLKDSKIIYVMSQATQSAISKLQWQIAKLAIQNDICLQFRKLSERCYFYDPRVFICPAR